MAQNYAKIISTPIPQSEPLDARQVKNNTSGFVYQIDDWQRLTRFLVLGSDRPTYYQKAVTLTRENAACVQRCYDADAERTVREIVDVSAHGRAPRADAAIFALALGAVHADLKVRQKVMAALPLVCRTATHLFAFVEVMKALGRKVAGRNLKRNIAAWYNGKRVADLTYQLIKYRNREGWLHADLMRLVHPTGFIAGELERGAPLVIDHEDGYDGATDVGGPAQRIALYRWVRSLGVRSDKVKPFATADLPPLVQAHLQAMKMDKVSPELLQLIRDHRLPWEALNTAVINKPEVQRELLPYMGLTALIRQLGRLTASDVLKPLSDETRIVVARLTDETALRKSRVHPMQVLIALAAYRHGRPGAGAQRGAAMTWTPVPAIVDALDEAFIMAFKNVAPTGKRRLIGLDVSASMTWPQSRIDGILPAREAATAMAMVTMRTEKNWHVCAFANGVMEVPGLSARSSLFDGMRAVERLPASATDCAAPMLYAMARGLSVDVFEVYTDNETNIGLVHPIAALRQYREATGIRAKLIVVGMTSTGFTIADPQEDGGCLDVVGFDANAPAVMADFIREGA